LDLDSTWLAIRLNYDMGMPCMQSLQSAKQTTISTAGSWPPSAGSQNPTASRQRQRRQQQQRSAAGTVAAGRA